MRSHARNVTTFLLLIALCSSGVCQQATSSWAAVQSASGSKLRITLNNAETHTGMMVRATDDELVLRDGRGEKSYSKQGISKVQVVGSRSHGRGALIGLAIGAGAGAIIGGATGGCGQSEICIISRADATGIVALVGGVVGTIIGALVGGGRKKTTLYVAPSAPHR
jgi:hypothetical protein